MAGEGELVGGGPHLMKQMAVLLTAVFLAAFAAVAMSAVEPEVAAADSTIRSCTGTKITLKTIEPRRGTTHILNFAVHPCYPTRIPYPQRTLHGAACLTNKRLLRNFKKSESNVVEDVDMGEQR